MPTSTAVICPKCSKVSYLSGDSTDVEKTCKGCGAKLVQAPKQPKFCVVCNKDITSRRRMKDREGKYFCYECGLADNKRKEQSESFNCQVCKRPFAAEKMFKRDGVFFCKRCYGVKLLEHQEEQERKAAEAKGGDAELSKKKKKMVGIVVINVFIVFFMLYQLKIIHPEQWFLSAPPPAPPPAAKQAGATQKPAAAKPAPPQKH